MSPNKSKKTSEAVRESSPEPGPSKSKRSKLKIVTSSDEEEDTVPKKAQSKCGSKFMRSPGFTSHNKPAELFRKDLISAMKMADSEQLQEGSYIVISDPWRQEWEKGVQVPVNSNEIMQPEIIELHERSKIGDFKIPHKLLHERVDSVYKKGMHELTGMQQLAEQLVRYDLDDLDVCWLEEVNFIRREMGFEPINEWNMERVMEALENQCHEKMTGIMKTEEGLGIEYDEDVVCDVCRSPDSEESNEMVFCDGCDVCVHQACYGLQSIPEGTWLCRTCALNIKPSCLLCPKVGGAMKSTRSGTKWAHVSCALWIPEVSIGIPEKMEPVCKISSIPPSRWALICSLCKERVGACIQCSVKTCKTAFHVTCGFSQNLDMKAILTESESDNEGVKFRAYCLKHSKKRERGYSESDAESPQKERPPTPKEMTRQERENMRLNKVKSLEEEFFSVVDLKEVSQYLQLDLEVVDFIFAYWKLKRKCNWEKPLLTPKTEEADILEKQQEDSLVARQKMFVSLRQDLERVRNLCYMISKREKMKRSFYHSRERVFYGILRPLVDKNVALTECEAEDIVGMYSFDSLYADYGLSVPNLPLEPFQDEDESISDAIKGSGRFAAADKIQDGARTETEGEEEALQPPQLLSPGERWSGEFVRTGFFKRRRHKKLLKHSAGPSVSKESQKKNLCDAKGESTTSPAAPDSEEKHKRSGDLDTSWHVTSADESEDDKKLIPLPPHLLDSRNSSGAENTERVTEDPQLGPKSKVASPEGKLFAFRMHRHKRRPRGRRPWHMKSTPRNLASDIDLSSGDVCDDYMQVSPVVDRSRQAGSGKQSARQELSEEASGDQARLPPGGGRASPTASEHIKQASSSQHAVDSALQQSHQKGEEGKLSLTNRERRKDRGHHKDFKEKQPSDAEKSKERNGCTSVKERTSSQPRRDRGRDKPKKHEKLLSEERINRAGNVCEQNIKTDTQEKTKHDKSQSEKHLENTERQEISKGVGSKFQTERLNMTSDRRKWSRVDREKHRNDKRDHHRERSRSERHKGSDRPKCADQEGSDTADGLKLKLEKLSFSPPKVKRKDDNLELHRIDFKHSSAKQPCSMKIDSVFSGDGKEVVRRTLKESESEMKPVKKEHSLDSKLKPVKQESSPEKPICNKVRVKITPVKIQGEVEKMSSNKLERSSTLKAKLGSTSEQNSYKREPKTTTLRRASKSERKGSCHSVPRAETPGPQRTPLLDGHQSKPEHEATAIDNASAEPNGALAAPPSAKRLRLEKHWSTDNKSNAEAVTTTPAQMSFPGSSPSHQLARSISDHGERSNIFECLERQRQEGGYAVELPAVPCASPEKSWSTSDWCEKLGSIVGEAARGIGTFAGCFDQQSKALKSGNGEGAVKETCDAAVKETCVLTEVPEVKLDGEMVQPALAATPVEDVNGDLCLSGKPGSTKSCSDSAASVVLQSLAETAFEEEQTAQHKAEAMEARLLSLNSVKESSFSESSIRQPRQKKEDVQPLDRRNMRKWHTDASNKSDAGRERHHRKSSDQARLRLTKVFSPPEDSDDDDFEPHQPLASLHHLRDRRSLVNKGANKSGCPIKSSGEDEEYDEESNGSSETRCSNFSQQRKEEKPPSNALAVSSHRTRSIGLRPEISMLMRPAELVVKKDIVRRVENAFCRRYRPVHPSALRNGALDKNQKKIDSFLQRSSSQAASKVNDSQKNRVLHEITSEKGSNFQNSIFGAHYIPKGSLSGYKIPKKNSSNPPSLPVEPAPTSLAPDPLSLPSADGVFGSGVASSLRSFKSEASRGSPRLRNKGAGDEGAIKKLNTAGSDVDSVVSNRGDHCDGSQFSLVACRGYRSQSPTSEGSTLPITRNSSRESTPRRFTRSQLAEDMMENSPSNSVAGTVTRTMLREGVLKAPRFTS